jgi:hypothetical protein
MTSVFLSLTLPLLIGILFIACILPAQQTPKRLWLIECFLNIGIGFGISSCLTFFALVTVGLLRKPILVTEIVLAVILFVLLFYKSKTRKEEGVTPQVLPRAIPIFGIRRALSVFFFIALALSFVIFMALSLKNPHGGWDAFAIWNLRARFMFRAGTHWTDAFSQHLSWSHLDYPLFIPTNIARSWVVVGNETVATPILLALLFTFGIVGLTVSSLSFLRGKSQGF